MANSTQLRVSMRNLYWAVAVAVVGIAAGLLAGWKVGLLAAVIVLVVSEIVERSRRRKHNRVPADATEA